MGTSGNKIDSNLTAANIKSGVQIFWLNGTFWWNTNWLPTNAISLLCALQAFNGRDWWWLFTMRIWFIETASFVYAALALFAINNIDDDHLYRLAVQKFDKTTGAWVATYLSNPIIRAEAASVAVWDTYLRVDSTKFYAVLATTAYKYISFDTATDTFSATSTTGGLEEFGIFDILTNSSTGNTNPSLATIQLYTSALTSASNLGTGNAPTTLTVWANTWGINYNYIATYFNGTDTTWAISVNAFVTRI